MFEVNILSLADQRFDNGVVELCADLLDRLIRAVGPGAVRQKGNGELAVGVDPDTGAGVAEMSIGIGAKIFSGLRRLGGSVPAERAGSACWSGFAAGEEGDRFRAENRGSALEHGGRENRDVVRVGEQARVSGYTAQDRGVFVLNFALDYAIAEGAAEGGVFPSCDFNALVGGWGNAEANSFRRVERRIRHG